MNRRFLAACCEESSIPNKDFSIFLLAYPAASSGECARGDSKITLVILMLINGPVAGQVRSVSFHSTDTI